MSKPHSNLFTRVVTALVLLPIVLATIWIYGLRIAFAALVAFVAAVATHELYALLRKCDAPVQEWAGVAGTVAMVAAAYFGSLAVVNVTLLGAIALVGFMHVTRGEPTGSGIAGSIMGLVYTGWCPAHIVLLHGFEPAGRGLVMLLLAAVVFTDTFAYFVGKNFGKHKFAPVVSPKKTWEGAIGGFVFAVGIAVALCYASRAYEWTAFPAWSVTRYALAAAAVSAVAQLSDLVKSSVKRSAGVKDSGTIFPGHGGALDRCDGFLFSAPVLYYMTVL